MSGDSAQDFRRVDTVLLVPHHWKSLVAQVYSYLVRPVPSDTAKRVKWRKRRTT